MEGYRKAILRNHNGDIILPQTAASMIGEEPDRRFVDNVEKILLNELAANADGFQGLLLNAEILSALASQNESILNLVENVPNNLSDFNQAMEDLEPLRRYVAQILEGLVAPPSVLSETSSFSYTIGVDDTDLNNPKLTLKKQDVLITQPLSYRAGDIWKVGESAPDVYINVPAEFIAFVNSRKTVLTFDDGLASTPLNPDKLNNVINSVQNESVTATGENIPQAFVMFDIKEYLERVTGLPDLDKTVKGFTAEVLTQPMDVTKRALTQSYVSGNVIQPVREATKKNDYSTNVFSNLTWEVTTTPEFLEEWMNRQGKAGLVTYGAAATSISIASPKLKLHIKNPYIGKTIQATKDMEKEFNILDWEIKE